MLIDEHALSCFLVAKVVEFIDQAVSIAKEAQSKSKKLKEFHDLIQTDADINSKCDDLRKQVNEFARKFSMPGHEDH